MTNLYYIATAPEAFRRGERARIVGKSFTTLRDGTTVLFYDVQYPDGMTDECPMTGIGYVIESDEPQLKPTPHE